MSYQSAAYQNRYNLSDNAACFSGMLRNNKKQDRSKTTEISGLINRLECKPGIFTAKVLFKLTSIGRKKVSVFKRKWSHCTLEVLDDCMELTNEKGFISWMFLRNSSVKIKKNFGFFKKNCHYIDIKLESGTSFRLKIENDKDGFETQILFDIIDQSTFKLDFWPQTANSIESESEASDSVSYENSQIDEPKLSESVEKSVTETSAKVMEETSDLVDSITDQKQSSSIESGETPCLPEVVPVKVSKIEEQMRDLLKFIEAHPNAFKTANSNLEQQTLDLIDELREKFTEIFQERKGYLSFLMDSNLNKLNDNEIEIFERLNSKYGSFWIANLGIPKGLQEQLSPKELERVVRAQIYMMHEKAVERAQQTGTYVVNKVVEKMIISGNRYPDENLSSEEEFSLADDEFSQSEEAFSLADDEISQSEEEFFTANDEFSITNDDFSATVAEFSVADSEISQREEEFCQNDDDFSVTDKDFSVTDNEFSVTDNEFSKSEFEFSKSEFEFSKSEFEFSKSEFEFSKSEYEFSVTDAEISQSDAEISQSDDDFSVNDDDFSVSDDDFSVSDDNFSQSDEE